MEEIYITKGHDQKLSSLTAMRNTEEFRDLEAALADTLKAIPDETLRKTFEKCFFNTIRTTAFLEEDGSVFLLTGDIPAMWLRDSAAQVMQYLFFAKKCESVRKLIRGLFRKQLSFIRIDPYANAFNSTANGNGHICDLPTPLPEVWERKFELDSLCYPFFLACKYFEKTGDRTIFGEDLGETFDIVMDVFRKEQHHAALSDYYHDSNYRPKKEQFAGHGGKVLETGLVWSGYRPSDDRCDYGYYLPGNMFIVSVLCKMEKVFGLLGDAKRAEDARLLAEEIHTALDRYAVTERDGKKIYALETDCLGHYNLMDDANIPNLLSLPYIEYPYLDEEVYKNTRDFILSKKNPYYFEGRAITGIGSPHTPEGYVWPLSLITEALTSDDALRIREIVTMLVHSTGGTGYMHEGVQKDDDTVFTRPWFAWANSLFSYMILSKFHLLFPAESAK